MRTSRYSALCLAILAAACAKGADRTQDSAAGAVASTPPAAVPAPAPAHLSLADVAGKWNVVGTPTEGKDSSTTTFILNATADTVGWTQTFPGRKPMTYSVRVEGDSIISHTGPYESVRRKGVKVTTDNVIRLQNGKLVGTTVAHYSVKTADSVLHLRVEGTKAP
jgi:hypothetical protein